MKDNYHTFPTLWASRNKPTVDSDAPIGSELNNLPKHEASMEFFGWAAGITLLQCPQIAGPFGRKGGNWFTCVSWVEMPPSSWVSLFCQLVLGPNWYISKYGTPETCMIPLGFKPTLKGRAVIKSHPKGWYVCARLLCSRAKSLTFSGFMENRAKQNAPKCVCVVWMGPPFCNSKCPFQTYCRLVLAAGRKHLCLTGE